MLMGTPSVAFVLQGINDQIYLVLYCASVAGSSPAQVSSPTAMQLLVMSIPTSLVLRYGLF